MARDRAYREAEKKIEEAWREGAKKLYLAQMSISELPETLSQLTQLEYLNIHYNRLSVLPEWICQLTQLRELKLNSGNLTKLPESLNQLLHLQFLDISENLLMSLPESLGQLTQLQALNLSRNQLTTLPESLGQLKQLQSLNLSLNYLAMLPESLEQLAQLQSLNLSNNELTALPISLGQLTQLRSLNLSYNELMAMPESTGQLTQLQCLFLYHNKLTTLPESMGQLVQLQELDISFNELTALPKCLQQLMQLQKLYFSDNQLPALPDWLGQLTQLQELHLSGNQLTAVPESFGRLTELQELHLSRNHLTTLPESFGKLAQLKWLILDNNQLIRLQESLGKLTQLQELDLSSNQLADIPHTLAELENFRALRLDDNPLNLELAEAYEQGHNAVQVYLRAKAAAQIVLNEAKLILVGEGEVGKSCLLGALRGDSWEEGRPTTHGIEIKPVKVTDTDSKKEITLNGWDFGGQRVYRPTHQLFFSAPAVYLVVWKPREGPQQGFVKEWIKLIKHREPEAKIFVVATHGGPQQRQPDIDRQELWDLFGKDTVIDFFHVESKPDEKNERRGIEELKLAIARVASSLPEMGRSVPKSFQDAREALQKTGEAYLPLERVLAICREHKMDDEVAKLFVTISHRLGHLIHYEHDPTLRDLVVLKPDWLATAISFVLDDEATRNAHGLVRFTRLGQLWNDATREQALRYPANLHAIFLRLMERFDLSYRVADPWAKNAADPQSLIAQLVPDTRPEKDLARAWPPSVASGDTQQVQICRIVDDKGQSATAEGLFYQLIVRLHKYSLGRADYNDSVHWQRGLVLDDDYNGRALLEHVGNDVRITVRAPYPERFLAMLTEEVKYLVESFWEGLRCDVTVPCLNPVPCIGLFEVRKLIENIKRGRPEQPCAICNEWQAIAQLLHNAPAAAAPISLKDLQAEFAPLKHKLDEVSATTKSVLSRVDKAYTDLIQVLTDEAKEGPRLFSVRPADSGFLRKPKWISAKFHLVLWCEHSRLPLFLLNNNPKSGVYELDLPREWVVKSAPFLKALTVTLSLVLPMASSATKLVLDRNLYGELEGQLKFGEDCFDAMLQGGEKAGEWLGKDDALDLPQGRAMRGEGAILRELHAYLKPKDPSFGGLVRVMNKRQEFLWVHPQFEGEY